MENQKNNKGVIALLIIIIVIISALCILFATGTISFKSNNADNNKSYINVLEKLDGVWGQEHYMISIKKDNKQYLQGQYETDGVIAGTISNIKEISKNKYELEVFIKGCTGDDCMEEKEDETKIISIEIDTTRNIIVNNNNEYQFITKNHSDNDTISAFFNSNKTNDNVNNNENSDLPKWANYLLEQNITEISYEKGILEHDKTTNTEDCTPAKTMTKEQLKNILSKMTKSKLKKYDAGGFGGPCWSGIIVKYDDKEFRIFMSKYIVVDNNDSHILSLIEKENYTLDSQISTPDPLWTYEYDWDTSYIDALF